MEERISGEEDSIESMKTTIKEHTKFQNILTQNIQEIQDTIRPNLRIIGMDKNEDFQLKGPTNIFNTITEKKNKTIKILNFFECGVCMEKINIRNEKIILAHKKIF